MSELLWRKLKEVKTPEAAGAAWTVALDYVVPKRLYRLKATAGEWTAKDRADTCKADGYARDATRGADPNSKLLVADAPLGCLIVKIGGSTADNTGQIFAAGRFCVFQIEETKAGPLYLGVNDLPLYMDAAQGQITVLIEMAL